MKRKEAAAGGEGGEERQQQRKEQDQNSWVYKYHYAVRPTYDYKIEVNAGTEVPPVVPKEARKKNPDKAAFEKTIAELEAQIEGKREKIR
jgi:hypothetical protein